MKKPTLLYIPLFVLFALALSVLAIHWSNVFRGFNVAASQIDMPLVINGEVITVRPEAEKAGMKFRAAEPRGIKRKEMAELNPLLRLDF